MPAKVVLKLSYPKELDVPLTIDENFNFSFDDYDIECDLLREELGEESPVLDKVRRIDKTPTAYFFHHDQISAAQHEAIICGIILCVIDEFLSELPKKLSNAHRIISTLKSLAQDYMEFLLQSNPENPDKFIPTQEQWRSMHEEYNAHLQGQVDKFYWYFIIGHLQTAVSFSINRQHSINHPESPRSTIFKMQSYETDIHLPMILTAIRLAYQTIASIDRRLRGGTSTYEIDVTKILEENIPFEDKATYCNGASESAKKFLIGKALEIVGEFQKSGFIEGPIIINQIWF